MYPLQYSSAEIRMESKGYPYYQCGGSLWVIKLNTRMPSAATVHRKKIKGVKKQYICWISEKC